jgi:hypothetical protein
MTQGVTANTISKLRPNLLDPVLHHCSALPNMSDSVKRHVLAKPDQRLAVEVRIGSASRHAAKLGAKIALEVSGVQTKSRR